MKEKQRKKQVSLMIIGVAILVIGLVGVTYAFFNYTRTGSSNMIKVGRIVFNSNQTENIGLINVFPIDSSNANTDNTNTDEAIITINGDTTYSQGIEYKITAVDVNNTINNKTIPISIIVTGSSGLGNLDASYFDHRGGNNSLYKVLAGDVIENNGQLVVGYITNGADGIDGSITIKAYLDKDKIAISDTYDGNETDNMGTTTNWVDERVTLTTSEWNSLSTNGLSFKVKVEAAEGIWVDEPIPTIDSCPGCKFVYTTNIYYYADTNPSTIADFEENNDTLVDDYTLLNKNYFLGFKIENDTVVKAYTCGRKGTDNNGNINQGTPFCLEASLDGSTYEKNKSLVTGTSLWNDLNFTEGRCIFNTSSSGMKYIECDGSVHANVYDDGYADAYSDDGYCYVIGGGGNAIHGDGYAYCGTE